MLQDADAVDRASFI